LQVPLTQVVPVSHAASSAHGWPADARSLRHPDVAQQYGSLAQQPALLVHALLRQPPVQIPVASPASL
jgi:hypothetical protein